MKCSFGRRPSSLPMSRSHTSQVRTTISSGGWNTPVLRRPMCLSAVFAGGKLKAREGSGRRRRAPAQANRKYRAVLHLTAVLRGPPDFRAAGPPPLRRAIQLVRDLHCVTQWRGALSGQRSTGKVSGIPASTNMNNITATSAIRARLRQRSLPTGELWRCEGEYAGGCVCDGCGERITSAQASYSLDFVAGVQPPTARLHRACFEIWKRECESPLLVQAL